MRMGKKTAAKMPSFAGAAFIPRKTDLAGLPEQRFNAFVAAYN